MALTATPYGLYVRKCIGARRNTAGNTHYPITANVTGTMYYGAPVSIATGGGAIAPIAASPTAGVLGVVQGAQWISPIRPEWFPSLPGGTFAAGGKNIEVMVNDDPGIIMMVQATGVINLTHVGRTAALVNTAAGNNSTGRSICALDHTTAVDITAALAVRIIGIVSPVGDPFPDVLVQWNTGVHAFRALSVDPGGVELDEVDPEEQQEIFEDAVWERTNQVREQQDLPPVEHPRVLREREEEERTLSPAEKEKRQKERDEKAAKRNALPLEERKKLDEEEREKARKERAAKRGKKPDARKKEERAEANDKVTVQHKPLAPTSRGKE